MMQSLLLSGRSGVFLRAGWTDRRTAGPARLIGRRQRWSCPGGQQVLGAIAPRHWPQPRPAAAWGCELAAWQAA